MCIRDSSACVDTFVDLKPKGKDGTSYFDVLCSPTLYSGQTVTACVKAEDAQNPDFRFFIEYFNEEDELEVLKSPVFALERGENLLTWEVPDTEGHAIYRLGIALTSQTCVDGSIILKTLDWSNVPVRYTICLLYTSSRDNQMYANRGLLSWNRRFSGGKREGGSI